jgi:antitoxin component of MazEF toxin-antitoxin module
MSGTMEKTHTDKVIKRGPGSLAVKIPAIIAKRFGVEYGEPVEYWIDGDDLILRFPKPIIKEAEKTVF